MADMAVAAPEPSLCSATMDPALASSSCCTGIVQQQNKGGLRMRQSASHTSATTRRFVAQQLFALSLPRESFITKQEGQSESAACQAPPGPRHRKRLCYRLRKGRIKDLMGSVSRHDCTHEAF